MLHLQVFVSIALPECIHQPMVLQAVQVAQQERIFELLALHPQVFARIAQLELFHPVVLQVVLTAQRELHHQQTILLVVFLAQQVLMQT